MMDSSSSFSPEIYVSADFDGFAGDETLVADDRAQLRPSEHVQTKLLSLLRSVAVPVSCLHSRRDVRRVATA